MSDITPADVGRCVMNHARKMSGSSDTSEVVARKAVDACSALFADLSAGRDARLAAQGHALSPIDSANWKTEVSEIILEIAIIAIDEFRREN